MHRSPATRLASWAVLPCCWVIAAAPVRPAHAQPPQGTVTKYSYHQSKIFPGTVRDYFVYVPKQYDPARPACVHVNQDGIQFKAPEVFDKLIDAGEMPVTIGVFVTPGVIKPPPPDAVPRFNRSFEYDGLGDAYVRFLLDELLPDVATKRTPDGRPIHLSQDGNDRSIGGSSSGAIAAFTAAWERPDAFRRVFSSIGTYVGLRGGNIYPTLIRKTEPKPIRVFLQDGSNDLNIYGGDWWMANQEMERALKFAGYEVEHAWGEGGHDSKQATQIFPDAMRFLWKDHPKPIAVGAGSKALQDILAEGEGWKLVGEGYKFTEGPTAGKNGEFFFSDLRDGKIYKIGTDGAVKVLVADSKNANGLQMGADGRLYTLATASEQLISYDADGGDPKVVASGFRGNDLVVRADGSIYATNPNVPGDDKSRVWYISPSGEKKIVDTGIAFANGVTLTADQHFLLVTDMRSHWIYSYLIQPDGSLTAKQKFDHVYAPDTADDTAADGLRVDRDGRHYIATRSGVQVADQLGRVNAIIPTPNGRCSNIGFGGEDMSTLYVAAGDKVYKRKLKTVGVRPELGPVKPPTPRL